MAERDEKEITNQRLALALDFRAQQVAKLEAEIERLREAVKQLGQIGDVCTYDTLGAICDGCRCPRRSAVEQNEGGG